MEGGADTNMATYTSPLILAAQNLSCECSKILFDFGADPNFSDRRNNTALSVAVTRFCYGRSHKSREAQLDYIKLLLKHGANPNIGVIDSGKTPLHAAAQCGHYKCMELLLDAGASVDAHTLSSNMTPICLACQGHADCTKLLLDWGANPNHIYEDVDVLPKTPLMAAVESDCAGCVKILAERGADANMATYTSPLILAAQNLSCECSKILLEFVADPNFSDRRRNTALSIAVTRFGYL